jgi:hypothetical protein
VIIESTAVLTAGPSRAYRVERKKSEKTLLQTTFDHFPNGFLGSDGIFAIFGADGIAENILLDIDVDVVGRFPFVSFGASFSDAFNSLDAVSSVKRSEFATTDGAASPTSVAKSIEGAAGLDGSWSSFATSCAVETLEEADEPTMALSFACVVETDDATVFLEPPNIARRISDAEGTDTDGAYVPYDRFALVVAGFIPPARATLAASIAAASAAATRRQSSSRSIASASAPSDASRSVELIPVRESGGIDAETSARSAGTSASRRVNALFAFFGTSDAIAFLASSSSASSIPRAAPKHRDAKRRRVATSFVFAKTSIDDVVAERRDGHRRHPRRDAVPEGVAF